MKIPSIHKICGHSGRWIPSARERNMQGVELELQGAHTRQDFWLESLGDVKVNWKQLTMKFKERKNANCLKGDSALTKTIMSLKSMLYSYSVKRGEQGLLVEFGALTLQTQSKHEISKEINILLEVYVEVCEQPVGLPPIRETIKQGENPPNIRPYRYPHLQKTEIEKLVNEMLVEGIICPSRSPYSS